MSGTTMRRALEALGVALCLALGAATFYAMAAGAGMDNTHRPEKP